MYWMIAKHKRYAETPIAILGRYGVFTNKAVAEKRCKLLNQGNIIYFVCPVKKGE